MNQQALHLYSVRGEAIYIISICIDVRLSGGGHLKDSNSTVRKQYKVQDHLIT